MSEKKTKRVRSIIIRPKNVFDVDYEKLATAIVEANNKQNQKHSVSREWMKFLIHPVLWAVAIMAGIMAVACILYGGGVLASVVSTSPNVDLQQFALGFLSICIGVFMVAVSLATAFTAREIDKETDRQYVASMFSNIVALVALIVALIALVKG